MTRLNIIAAALGIIATPAFSQNLLENSIPEDAVLDNKEYFYTCWSAYKPDGTQLGWESAPTSYFATVNQGFQINALEGSYGHYTIGGGNDQGFAIGDDVMILDYRGQNGICYSYPISVPKAATYRLSGAIKVLSPGTRPSDPAVPNNALSVFVAESTPGNKSIKIVNENGKNRLAVTDASGKEYPNVWKPTSSDIHSNVTPISGEAGDMVLTPDLKYLSIYAPTSLMVVSKLSLDRVGPPTSIDFTIEDECCAATEWYDLSGKRIAKPAVSGIYIERKGSKVRKIIVSK